MKVVHWGRQLSHKGHYKDLHRAVCNDSADAASALRVKKPARMME